MHSFVTKELFIVIVFLTFLPVVVTLLNKRHRISYPLANLALSIFAILFLAYLAYQYVYWTLVLPLQRGNYVYDMLALVFIMISIKNWTVARKYRRIKVPIYV